MELLSEKGYEVKKGKHLAVKPPGMPHITEGKEKSVMELFSRFPGKDMQKF